MADQFGPKRPFGVTIVVALAIVSGALDLIGGIVLLTMQADQEIAELFGGTGVLLTLAITSILAGAVMLLIAYGLFRGNAVARIAATVVQLFSLASSVTIGVMQPSSLVTEILSALFALAILLLLWSTDATRYFRGLAPEEPVS